MSKRNILDIILIVIVCQISLSQAVAQDRSIFLRKGKNDTIPVATVNLNGELIPWIAHKEVLIKDKRIFVNVEAKQNYIRLRRNIIKVLPYAKYARLKYQKLERDMALTSDIDKQKQLVKDCEKEIKALFNKEVKNMTISQGEVLIKLIDRETGHSSYELVKELKGTLTAFFFQSIARVFGHNLKTEYDAEQERDIESILSALGYNSLQQ